MHILALTASSAPESLFRYAFSGADFSLTAAHGMNGLLHEIRHKVPDVIILDKDFFPQSETAEEVSSYISTSIFFEKFDFLIFLYNVHNHTQLFTLIFESAFCTERYKKRIIALLDTAAKKIKDVNKIPENFRPIEKKLYNLLKSRAEEEVSLTEMSYELWGGDSGTHIKTLYTYIYRIKHMLEDNQSRPEMLVKTKKGFYKLTFESS